MTEENPPFEDIFPIEHVDIPARLAYPRVLCEIASLKRRQPDFPRKWLVGVGEIWKDKKAYVIQGPKCW